MMTSIMPPSSKVASSACDVALTLFRPLVSNREQNVPCARSAAEAIRLIRRSGFYPPCAERPARDICRGGGADRGHDERSSRENQAACIPKELCYFHPIGRTLTR